MTSMPRRHVVCLGDSITRGQVSVDYVTLLARRTFAGPYVFTNAGANGDLAENALQRLDSVIDLRPDLVTVLIGTNDANASMSERNIARFTRMKKLTARPTIEGYRDNVTAIIDRLTRETSARIGLLSLPVLGEELGSESVQRSQQYSAVLKQIAETRGIAYLPLNERQIAHLQAGGFAPGIRYSDGLALSAGAAIQHFILRRSLDDISRRRGLQLTTDLLHQNTRGATMIADLIEEFVSQTSDV
ncbi:SGNH/GDSL hydrolase family protein [Mycobacterium sp.]|jgi:lysophospholipase L1-like esterase|uniref:SGNH/GDSL hydrolase family protein n=1 Tax=Mycobacterium sp. TaxID=1785 RepID=UPI002D4B18FF|nr:SGNH/GDSL hydrolase family protein [Mycobacterium sp.]HZA11469.1 SGNH/GDSL hydrolase family protein [Mycobacterium sp.]